MPSDRNQPMPSPLRRKWAHLTVPKDSDGAFRVENRKDGRKPPNFEDPK